MFVITSVLQDRLASFFESMGWKVFTVPEAATVLLNGGVKFAELNHQQAYQFQKDLLLTLIQIEQVRRFVWSDDRSR